MVLQRRVHYLTPPNITLHDRKYFLDVNKAAELEMVCMDVVYSHEAWKAKNLLWQESRKNGRREGEKKFQVWEGFNIAFLALRRRSPCAWTGARPRGAQGRLPGSSKETGTSFLKTQGLDSARYLNELRSIFSTEPPVRIAALPLPWLWSCESLSRGSSWATVYLDFWPVEIWHDEWMSF